LGFSQTDCNSLPVTYSSYSQALSSVKGAKFNFTDNANTSRSSFITSARYYSCDGKTGFLIIGLQGNDYIHKNLPKTLWLHFKQASSLGSFYDQYIRGRYALVLKN
jgi:hypothetical protein